jgi:hypothetical protein
MNWTINFETDPSISSSSVNSSTSTVLHAPVGCSPKSGPYPGSGERGKHRLDKSACSSDLGLSSDDLSLPESYPEKHFLVLDHGHEGGQSHSISASHHRGAARTRAMSFPHAIDAHTVPHRGVASPNLTARRNRRPTADLDDFTLGPGTPTIPSCCETTSAGAISPPSNQRHPAPADAPANASASAPNQGRHALPQPAARPSKPARRRGDRHSPDGGSSAPASRRPPAAPPPSAPAAAGTGEGSPPPSAPAAAGAGAGSWSASLDSEGALCLPAGACGGPSELHESFAGLLEWQVSPPPRWDLEWEWVRRSRREGVVGRASCEMLPWPC